MAVLQTRPAMRGTPDGPKPTGQGHLLSPATINRKPSLSEDSKARLTDSFNAVDDVIVKGVEYLGPVDTNEADAAMDFCQSDGSHRVLQRKKPPVGGM